MNKYTLVTALIFLALLAHPQSASAALVCQSIYTGGQTCTETGDISLNKTVLKPGTTSFVENLGFEDTKFAPDQTVTFQITVKNTTDTTISQVTVKDILPPVLTFVAGPGTFDANTKTLSFEVLDLKAREARVFTLTAQVVASTQLQSNDIVCAVNQAQAIVANGGQTKQDNTQFCMQKPAVVIVPAIAQKEAGVTPSADLTALITKGGLKVFPPVQAAKTPSTGPELLALLGLLPIGIFGQFLRKRAIKG